MTNAAEKNDASRAPLTQEELANIGRKYQAGKISLVRRAPMLCECGAEMWGQYVGHRHEVAEWEYRCPACGKEWFA